MKIYLNSAQMKEADRITQEVYGMSGTVLMERAALFSCSIIKGMCEKDCCIALLCGCGNNGGDGIATARLLWEEGYRCAVFLCGDISRMTDECRRQYEIAKNYEVPFLDNKEDLSGFGLIVDAMVGVGFKGELREEAAEFCRIANSLPAKKLAIDMPSGVSSDDGSVSGEAFKADLTVTFGFEKQGAHLYPGKAYCGEILRGRIGITDKSLPDNERFMLAIERTDPARIVPARKQESHKGTYGKVLVVAGSVGMAGAAYMCALSALTMGCGMVRILSVPENRVILQSLLPEAMFDAISEENYEDELEQGLDWADVVVAGCGLSKNALAFSVVEYLVKNCSLPMVLDADALNLFSEEHPDIASPDCVFTPHIGEMARLTGDSTSEINSLPLSVAEAYARQLGVTLVLKNASTVIFDKNGQGFINDNGCSGMATGGSGDVLSGVIAGIMAQKVPGRLAAPVGAYIHGMAGSVAAEKKGESGMKATDIIEALTEVGLG